MKLADLNPQLVRDRMLWFDCPLHAGQKGARCGGRVGVRLQPPAAVGWRWSGDWPTWFVTLTPSWRSELCGAHLEVCRGEVTVFP